MTELRFAALGAGFWARYQLSAWGELPGVRCVALCDRDRAKAEALARDLGIPAVYDQPEALFASEQLDFVDVITGIESHGPLVLLAAEHRIPVICQKPMAPSWAEAEGLVDACRRAGIPFLIHENWRWQTPLRRVKEVLQEGRIGTAFRARINMISGFPVFVNQPSLKELERFVLADMGSHLLDVARFLFGEPRSLYARTHRVHADIRGDDEATVVLTMGEDRTTVICEMAFAENPLERDCFPQTLAFVEADRGSLELAPDFWVRVTTTEGTHSRRHPPPSYRWANPDYAVVHSSMVPCLASLLGALRSGDPTRAETHAEDNLKTLRLIFAGYESAREDRVVPIES
ncbi:MAG TPA: Gfo/Idh/MocA family oxidoreductase [Isosphaeraceae bacterium]|nr:Gfo/Idh/MocA family oxidoreductase [Isosphaeraceae bacterium]